jgi:hypothetical protein
MTGKRVFAQAHYVLAENVHATLHKDMQFSKKAAKWVTKLLDEEGESARGEIMTMIAAAS